MIRYLLRIEDMPKDYKYAVVMVYEMSYDIVNRSPAVEADTDIAYPKGAWCATSLATFISALEYKAIPAVNEIGVNVPMAVNAGLFSSIS